MTGESISPTPAPRSRPAWPVWTVAIFFAVLYSYALWAGIGNAVGVPQSVWANYHLGISAVGWVLLGIGVLLSPAVFVLCLLVGRGRGLRGARADLCRGALRGQCPARFAARRTHFRELHRLMSRARSGHCDDHRALQ